jgi:transcriptional regulator with XRE-family HTH domain
MNRRPDATDKHVGKRIRMRRLMLNMTQEDLAGQLKLTYQQLQKYETGANRISAGRLLELSHALRAPIEFFFDGLPGPKGKSAAGNRQPSQGFVSDFFASAQGLALAGVFIRVRTPALRRRIVRLVEEFAAGSGGNRT